MASRELFKSLYFSIYNNYYDQNDIFAVNKVIPIEKKLFLVK